MKHTNKPILIPFPKGISATVPTIFDLEITLNRFGIYKIQPNKVQFLFFRFSWWCGAKVSICLEVNWKARE